jgi:hypothetical protein
MAVICSSELLIPTYQSTQYHNAEDYNIPRRIFGIVGGGVQLGLLGTAATNGLLCQSRVIMMMEKLLEL